MSCGCDRPYPYFKADIEKISVLAEHGWCQTDLGLLFLAYESIMPIYAAAKALIAGNNGKWKSKMTPKEKHLKTALLNYYDRCMKANFCVDLQEDKLRKAVGKGKKKNV